MELEFRIEHSILDTRYTKWLDIGSEDAPAFNIEEKGPYISENEASNDNIRYSAA